MKDYSDKKACNDLITELRDIYSDKAKTVYELLKRGYESPSVKTTEKIILEYPLNDWFRSVCYQWVEGNKEKNGVDANIFEGEPEVSAAALFFMDFVSGTRRSHLTVDSPHMPFLNVLIDCKFVSILFEEFHRICIPLEEMGTRLKPKWSYLTCAVRLGTSVENEINRLFPDLALKAEKEKRSNQGKPGAKKRQIDAETRKNAFAKEFFDTIKPDENGVARIGKSAFEKMIKKYTHDGLSPSHTTEIEFKKIAKALLEKEYGKGIEIKKTK